MKVIWPVMCTSSSNFASSSCAMRKCLCPRLKYVVYIVGCKLSVLLTICDFCALAALIVGANNGLLPAPLAVSYVITMLAAPIPVFTVLWYFI